MTDIEKLMEKVLNTKGLISDRHLIKILKHYGYTKTFSKGSHTHFRKEGAISFVVPIHNGKIKHFYVHDIINQIKEIYE